jgi:hypothetical protein
MLESVKWNYTYDNIPFMWNKEELFQQWKDPIIVPVYWKGYKTGCNNYRGISLLSTSYKNFI